jgi:hypothetical protein
MADCRADTARKPLRGVVTRLENGGHEGAAASPCVKA